MLGLSILKNHRTFSIELRERNYPTFEGKYNAYVAVWGQLSGQYLGAIDTPIKSDITEDEAPQLLNELEAFISSHNVIPVIW
jgi:hypothetical protein